MRRSKTRSKILAVVMLALSVLSMASLGGITLLAGCAAEKVRDTVGVKTSMAMAGTAPYSQLARLRLW